MDRSQALISALAIALILAMVATFGPAAQAAHLLPVGLGAAAPFAILAGTPSITNVPTSTITGNVGLSPASGAGYAGLTCVEVTGTIYSVDAAGPLPCRVTDPGLLTTAKAALTTAIGDAAGRPGGVPVSANQLAGQILPHGVYNSGAAMDLAGGGTLTLDGGGDPNAVFIFQLGTLLTVGNASTVNLTNGAQSCNVFWQVDSATIGTTATFRGTILAATSITVANGSTVDGRLLAGTGNVTLISDTITRPTCAAPPALIPPTRPPFTVAPSATASPTPTIAPTASPTATAAASVAGPTQTPAPVAAVTPAPSASPRASVPGLPSSSTLDRSVPLMVIGFLMIATGSLILRSRRFVPTVR